MGVGVVVCCIELVAVVFVRVFMVVIGVVGVIRLVRVGVVGVLVFVIFLVVFEKGDMLISLLVRLGLKNIRFSMNSVVIFRIVSR